MKKKNQLIKSCALVLMLLPQLTVTAIAGSSMKINSSTYDSNTGQINLHGINFDAFGPVTVVIGDLTVEGCTINPLVITCDVSETPIAEGGNFTVSVSGGKSPHSNEEIDVFIPTNNLVAACYPDSFVACFPGDPTQRDVGECRVGTQTCLVDGSWSSCEGAVSPVQEVCDDGLDNDCDGIVDNGCVTSASAQIQQVRDSANGPVDILISGAYVTYLKPAVPPEPAGFFIQAEPTGPAIYVDVEPGLLDPPPAVGDKIELRVIIKGEINGLQSAQVISEFAIIEEDFDIGALVQDLNNIFISNSLDAYESELNTTRALLMTDFSAADTGYVQAWVQTSGDPTGGVYLRIPAGLPEALLPADTCLNVMRTPLWRFLNTPQLAAWRSADIETCIW